MVKIIRFRRVDRTHTTDRYDIPLAGFCWIDGRCHRFENEWDHYEGVWPDKEHDGPDGMTVTSQCLTSIPLSYRIWKMPASQTIRMLDSGRRWRAMLSREWKGDMHQWKSIRRRWEETVKESFWSKFPHEERWKLVGRYAVGNGMNSYRGTHHPMAVLKTFRPKPSTLWRRPKGKSLHYKRSKRVDYPKPFAWRRWEITKWKRS